MVKKSKQAKSPRQPKTRERELNVSDAVSEAFGELQSLGEEMREAFDNTPESLQNGGVGERRGEAADALENINEPDVPEALSEIMVKWSVMVLSPSAQRRISRSSRRDDAVTTLNAVKDCLQERIDDEKEDEEVRDAAESFIDDIDQMIDEAEAVEFPTMFG